ncbi:MIP/aquaporin family protein [Companilactobacillus sp.]|uniref:MIP/aquaporin family protein n=1 Tax=Companilactobacillus sp. TaxID=2767905 RepID=UPI0025C57AA0|nr:MIP/aquaporin family protein [Companilactobacillus sp.]MCH4009209.1 aquaporin family protein [Companilactobacillus sp.]MCH4050612.1 aquaporin family protein [Companilactobacillus sp.]MCH4077151.1 aquaporin family protein [Companilactobacillus sp.]MCH4125727.1 aquaporin family protein [Companilactobacillus sp.]MCI1311436.1 aquaporin family protein [Companilactobacillus sp.]
MHYTLFIRCVAEFMGTALMVALGNGSVANVELKGTKGFHGGWILIGFGYGIGVMIPAMMFAGISGAQINPAMTLALAVNGQFPWAEVFPYVLAQMLGGIFGQACIVAAYKPYYNHTTNAESILGTFSTIDNEHSQLNGFINEFLGTFVLVLGAVALTADKIDLRADFIGLGFLVMALVVSLGGATGPALNPARDLGPRLLHAILPLQHKGSSQFSYSWVPVVAPILGGICAVKVWSVFFG